MAPSRNDEQDPPVDPLVEKIQRFYATREGPGAVQALWGYVGRPSPETIRLYFNLELSRWVDIPRDAIVSWDASPLGGSLVWVKPESKLVPGSSTRPRTAAEFLRGEVAEGATAGLGPLAAQPIPTPWCTQGGFPTPWCTGTGALPTPWCTGTGAFPTTWCAGAASTPTPWCPPPQGAFSTPSRTAEAATPTPWCTQGFPTSWCTAAAPIPTPWCTQGRFPTQWCPWPGP